MPSGACRRPRPGLFGAPGEDPALSPLRRRLPGLGPIAALLLLAACVMPGGQPLDPEAAAAAAAAEEAAMNRQLAEVHRNLAQTLEEAGETEAAVQDYKAAAELDAWAVERTAVDLSGTPIGDLERICEDGAGKGDPAEAVARACTLAISSGRLPVDRLAVMLGRRGVARLELGETEPAMADFREALMLDSSDPDILVARGRAQELSGNVKGALADYSLALLRAPNRSDLRFARARLRARFGDNAGAAADYDRILSDAELMAAHPEAYRERAAVHCRLGRSEAAEIGWQVWADTDPGGPDYVRDMLFARGYLRGPGAGALDAREQAALRAWIRAGCPTGDPAAG